MADTKISALTNYTTPLDADVVPVVDTANTTTKKTTWANIKATLKTYLDTLYQPLDSDLTTIAGLTATTDNFIQAKSSAWASRTVAQVKTDLGLTGTNSGDETTSTLGATINGAGAATPNDTDLVATVESSVVKKITWTNVKAFLKTYFDTLYLPLAGGTLTGSITLGENTSIKLDPAGSADGKYSGITIAGTAGTTLAFGDLVYLAVADSRWELADADAATTSDRMMGMVVLAAAADGDPTTILLMGQIRADAAFPALTIGAAVYVGETAGDIQVSIPTGADNIIRRVGYALTADEIYFNPSMDSQITVA